MVNGVSREVSLERIAAAARTIDPVFRNTPQFRVDSLEAPLGLRHLTLKVETINPIRSFKGRGADFYVSSLEDRSQRIVCASAGNFGQGIAYAARRRGIPVTVFAAETANPRKIERMRALGAEVQLAGADFDSSKLAAAEFARTGGHRHVEDGRDLEIAEGAGSIAVELAVCRDELDHLLVPIGNGALIIGVATWMKHARPDVRITGVCAANAPSMKLSFDAGRPVETATADTIADGIAVRVPIPEAVDLMCARGIVDDVLLVSEESLTNAMTLLEERAALIAEPAGAAGIAALLEHRARFAESRVATILCGANRRG